jgi:hypothetical protein
MTVEVDGGGCAEVNFNFQQGKNGELIACPLKLDASKRGVKEQRSHNPLIRTFGEQRRQAWWRQ